MVRKLVMTLLLVAVGLTLGGCPTREDVIKAQNARDGADRPAAGGQSEE